MKDIFRSTVLLTVTCLVASGLLAAVFQATKPIIEMNKFSKEIDALRSMVPEPTVWVGAGENDAEVLRAVVADDWAGDEEKVGKINDVDVWIGRTDDGSEICRVLKTSERGYSSDIEMLVAVSADASCKAVSVLNQNETPGLGTNIMNPEFLAQFNGKKLEQVRLKKDGGEIDAITGATISSTAAVNAVRKAMEPKRKDDSDAEEAK